MSVSVAFLYKKAKKIYSIQSISGQNGMNRSVQWVHMLEDEVAATFLRGNELVFTTGIGHSNEEWLLPFAQGLVANKASGLIINLGPYIAKAPLELVDYCEKQNFPLFTIPWEIHLVDVTRYFCRCIMHNEQKELNISESFKQAIFFPNKDSAYQGQLESHGFNAHWAYCIAVLSLQTSNTEPPLQETTTSLLTAILSAIEILLHHLSEHFCIFLQNNQLIIVFANASENAVKTYIEQIKQCLEKKEYPFSIGIGQNKNGLLLLSKSYKQALSALQLAKKSNCREIYYDAIGIYKILLSTNDVNVLYEIYNETLGKLADYDQANKTDYISTLKYYLENDASVQIVANKTFVHRNTINYKLKKIKEIMNSPIDTVEERLRILLAYKIKDIL